MINLGKELTMMMNSVEKIINERERRLTHLENQKAKFWSDVAGPAISNLKEEIDKLKGRSSHREPSISNEPIRILRVRNDNDDMNWEFSFKIEVIKEDLNLLVKLGEDDKKYPLEEINKDQIYQIFIEQYKKELIKKFAPEYINHLD